jgi:novobiocin biosynthesis protein NovU/D-mycarose 3-C-methyltransferase
MQRHFHRLFIDLESEAPPTAILEIGSNDGKCLAYAKSRGWINVFGIEPAKNLGQIAFDEYSVPSLPEFFEKESAHVALNRMGNPSVILARHCFAHVNDWREFMAGLEILAGKDTVIALEVPYVHDTLAKTEFDQIYHEHLSFISISSIYALLLPTPFKLQRIIRYGIHGGSLLIMLRHKSSGAAEHLSVDEFMGEDLVTKKHWSKFEVQAFQKINRMRDIVRGLIADGKRVCGFGASAKATVWINACGFTEKDLLFVSDNSPLKPGCYIPGTFIPVIAQDEFLSEHPDYAIMFAWNFKTEILESQKKWRQRGGKFLIPTVDGVEVV